jgi:hypothetical protein
MMTGVDGIGPKRFSVQRKMAIVARLLRGEPLELVARETNVSIARLSAWRERALAAGPQYSGPSTPSKSCEPRSSSLPLATTKPGSSPGTAIVLQPRCEPINHGLIRTLRPLKLAG